MNSKGFHIEEEKIWDGSVPLSKIKGLENLAGEIIRFVGPKNYNEEILKGFCIDYEGTETPTMKFNVRSMSGGWDKARLYELFQTNKGKSKILGVNVSDRKYTHFSNYPILNHWSFFADFKTEDEKTIRILLESKTCETTKG